MGIINCDVYTCELYENYEEKKKKFMEKEQDDKVRKQAEREKRSAIAKMRSEEYKARERKLIESRNLDEQEKLKLLISELPFPLWLIDFFKSKGIITVQDLVSTPRRKFEIRTLRRIDEVFSRLGISYKQTQSIMKSTKPISHVRPERPVTDEEKKNQALQFLASRREQFAVNILCHIINGEGDYVNQERGKEIVDTAVSMADHLLEKLYPIKEDETDRS